MVSIIWSRGSAARARIAGKAREKIALSWGLEVNTDASVLLHVEALLLSGELVAVVVAVVVAHCRHFLSFSSTDDSAETRTVVHWKLEKVSCE